MYLGMQQSEINLNVLPRVVGDRCHFVSVLYRNLYLKLFLSRNLFNFDEHCSCIESLDAL